MDAGAKVRWLAALRGGQIAQGTGMLININGSMCCLGVLAHACGKDPNATKFNDHTELLDAKFAESLGLSRDEQNNLAAKNDAGETFAQIADYIEERL